MNNSKKHKKHVAYRIVFNNLDGERNPTFTRQIIFYEMRRGRRKAMREVEKYIRSRAWQKRLWEQKRGIKR